MSPKHCFALVLFFLPLLVSAQFNVAILATGSCADDSLKVQVDESVATRLIWKKDGIQFQVTPKTIISSAGATIAGIGVSGLGTNELSYPISVGLDSMGNLYVLDAGNNYRIQKFAPGSTTGITVFGNSSQSVWITGMFITRSGAIYLSDGYNNRVTKWLPGDTSGVVVAGGNGAGTAANQLAYPRGLYVDTAGNVYIADCDNHRVQRWASGATAGVTVAGGNGTGFNNNQLNWPLDVSVDAAGNVFALTSFFPAKIMRWAPGASAGMRVAGGTSTGPGANELGNDPQDFSVDADGNIYIADGANSRIQKWVSGASSGTTVAGSTQLTNPVCVLIDQYGNLIVADAEKHSIIKFTASFPSKDLIPRSAGSFSAEVSFGNSVAATNSVNLFAPPSVAITATGGSYICQGNSTTLSVPIDPAANYQWLYNGSNIAGAVGTQVTAATAGNYKLIASANGCTNSSLNYPVTVAPLPVVSISATNSCLGGNLSVTSADTAMKKIEWTRNGVTVASTTRQLLTYGTTVAGGNGSGSGSHQFSSPQSVTLDSGGNMYVVELGNHRVTRWAPGSTTGVVVAGGNGNGSATNQLGSPNDLYLDGNGNMYISEPVNSRITKWLPGATSGIVVAGGNGSGSLSNQLQSPNAVTLDDEGFMYITNAGSSGSGRIVKWKEGETAGVTLAGNNGTGTGAHQLNFPYGIYIDKSGTIYISDGSNSRIQKWNRRAMAGETVAGGNGSGSASNQLQSPRDLVMDDVGNLYISNITGHRVTKWVPGAASGVTVAGTGTSGNAPNMLNSPNGLFISPGGDLYIADASNHRIQKYASFIARSFTPTEPGIYRAIVTYGTGCVVVSDSIEIFEDPQVNIHSSGGEKICTDSSTVLSINDTTATSIQWMRNNAIIANATADTFIADTSGIYRVKVSMGSCSFISDSMVINHYAPPFAGENICAVSVDSASGKNIVVWQKTDGHRTKAFKIYRETSTANQYEALSTIDFDDLSSWTDSSSNPLQQSYSYRIAVVDSCGKESAMSLQHRTSHLQSNLGVSGEVNLSWSPYQGFSYGTFYIMRSLGGGPYVQIGQVSSNTFSFSDVNPPSGQKRYRVEIEIPGGCNGLARTAAASRLRSNVTTIQAGIPVVLKWIGCNTNSWLNPANWLGGVVPSSFDHVEINGAPCFQPKIPDGVTVSCRSLKVAPGVQLSIGAGANLNILE